MKSTKPSKQKIRNERCEHHSNLALVSVVMAMIGFVALMFVYIGDHNSANAELVITSSRYLGIAYWVAAAITAYSAVRKGKKYLAEYIIHMLVFGFFLFFMYFIPGFIHKFITGTALAGNWARYMFKGLTALLSAYTVVSIGWHLILATPGKAKK